MQIAILGRNIRPPWNEAVKNMAYELALQLAGKGHEVHLISNDSETISQESNLHVHPVAGKSFAQASLKKIEQLEDAHRIDLIHIQNLLIHRSLAGLVKSLKRTSKVPIVSYCCQLPALSISDWLKVARKDPREAFSSKLGMLAPDFLTKSAMKNVDMILTSSLYIQKHLSTSEDNKLTGVIHPFVRTGQMTLEPKNEQVKTGPQKLLYLGSHKILRGEDDFLRMLSKVKQEIPELKADLVTNYPIPTRIKRMIDHLGLRETVEFLPREVQLDVRRLIEESSMYVFTGLPPVGAIDPPLTIIESLILGTPVLSYDAAGISEVLSPDNLVKYGDVKALASEARKRLAQAVPKIPRPDLLETFGSENAARQFEKYYDKLI